MHFHWLIFSFNEPPLTRFDEKLPPLHIWWKAALMKSCFDEKLLWWKAALMKSRFDEKPLRWKAASIKSRFNKKPLSWKAASPSFFALRLLYIYFCIGITPGLCIYHSSLLCLALMLESRQSLHSRLCNLCV